MTNESQKNFIVAKLMRDGYVSRNYCLRHYISRLAAIIAILKKEGWDFVTEFKEENGGKNFYYKVLKSPVKVTEPQLFLIEEN